MLARSQQFIDRTHAVETTGVGVDQKTCRSGEDRIQFDDQKVVTHGAEENAGGPVDETRLHESVVNSKGDGSTEQNQNRSDERDPTSGELQLTEEWQPEREDQPGDHRTDEECIDAADDDEGVEPGEISIEKR